MGCSPQAVDRNCVSDGSGVENPLFSIYIDSRRAYVLFDYLWRNNRYTSSSMREITPRHQTTTPHTPTSTNYTPTLIPSTVSLYSGSRANYPLVPSAFLKYFSTAMPSITPTAPSRPDEPFPPPASLAKKTNMLDRLLYSNLASAEVHTVSSMALNFASSFDIVVVNKPFASHWKAKYIQMKMTGLVTRTSIDIRTKFLSPVPLLFPLCLGFYIFGGFPLTLGIAYFSCCGHSAIFRRMRWMIERKFQLALERRVPG